METEVYSILPEVQAIYEQVIAENANLTTEEIDAEVERIYNARKDQELDDAEVERVEDREQPAKEDEIKNLQSAVDGIETRMSEFEAGQEKIVSVLETLVEKDKAKETEVSDDEQPSNSKKAENAVKKKKDEESEAMIEDDSEEVEVIEVDKDIAEKDDEDVDDDPEDDDDDDDDKKKKSKNSTEVEDSEEVVETEESAEAEPEVETNAIEESETEEKGEEQPAQEEVAETNNNTEETMTEEQINALVARIKNEIADEAVQAPEVEEVAVEEKVENSFNTKNYRVRYNEQVAAAWDAYRLKSAAGMEKLNKINEFNYNQLVKEGLVENDIVSSPITIDGNPGIGGFVLPPEIDRMIHGKRTDYSALLSQISYDQTSSLQFAYATRVGDINMRPVRMCESGSTITDDANHVRPDNLKAIEGYSLKQGLAQLEEFAAVTPICTSVTRFAAADILADVAAGYRTDYDRKLAQLFVVRLQQAVNLTDNLVEFDPASATDALVDFVKATTKVSDGVVNGKFLFNAKTKAALLEYIFKSGNGGDLTTNAFTNGDVPTIFGFPYVVVPNDLLPTLGEGDTKTFVAQSLDGTTIETVDITSPVFYGDFSEYRGKIHGGLSYDVSAEATYEVYNAAGVQEVRSAWQRNELVLRGSFYRGGYFADPTVVSGLVPVSS